MKLLNHTEQETFTEKDVNILELSYAIIDASFTNIDEQAKSRKSVNECVVYETVEEMKETLKVYEAFKTPKGQIFLQVLLDAILEISLFVCQTPNNDREAWVEFAEKNMVKYLNEFQDKTENL